MGVKIRERPNGSGVWWIFVDHHGKRKAKKIGDKRSATRLAGELQAQLAESDLGFLDKKETSSSLNHYINLWLGTSARSTLRESTRLGYIGIFKKHIKGSIGRQPVDGITELDVENFLLGKLERLSHSSVTHIRNCMSGGFKIAKRDRAITVNPCHGFIIGSKQDASRKPRIEPLNSTELMHLLDTYAEHRPGYRDLIMVLGFAGLRIGEAVALKWSDIHFKARYISVERTYSHGVWSTTKSGKERKVDLSRQLATVLLKRKLLMAKNSDLIFPSGGSKPVNADNFRKRIFYPMLKKAKLRHVRVHDLRHTYASLLIEHTRNLHYVKEQLGHSSIKVTSDIYGHLLKPEGDDRQVDKLDAIFRNLSAT